MASYLGTPAGREFKARLQKKIIELGG